MAAVRIPTGISVAPARATVSATTRNDAPASAAADR